MVLTKKKKGLIMVYTGDGKGKTTAAVGQALRMRGHGYRIYMIHFMKGRDYGEFLAFQQLTDVTVIKAGRDEFVNRENPDPLDIKLAQKGFSDAKEALYSKKFDVVVLDEINVAIDFGLIPVEDVVELLNNNPDNVDIILTGRNAPGEIIEIADLVSEVKEIKHHYRSGIKSRKGVEF